MAKIPGEDMALADVSGPAPSTATVAPTDFGLGLAAQTADQVGEYQRRAQISQIKAQATADRKSVEPALLGLANANADRMATEATQWDGQTPGFAHDQIGKARTETENQIAANPDWTPGQKSEFRFAADQQTAQFGLRAIDHEAATLAQTAGDRQQVVVNGAQANFQKAYQGEAQTLKDNYDGSQTGLTEAALQAFDKHAAEAVAAAPPALQPRLQATLSAQRVEEAAKFGALEAHGQDAFVYKNTLDQAGGLIDTIVSNPTAYDSVVGSNLPQLVAAIPAGLRKDALHDLTAEAATARVRGLIQGNNPGQAQAELNDGRYDAFLKPEAKEALLASTGAALRDKAPKSIDQALQQQDIERRANAETYALLSTGQSTGQISAADLNQLPLDRAASLLTNWKTAQQTFAQAGAVRDMPSAQVAALASTAPPTPDDPDYANKLGLWETQRQAAQDELKTRQQPGAWAFASGGKAALKGAGVAGASVAQDRGAALQKQWADVQTLTGDAQRAAGGQYASTMIGAQAAAGIPANARQIVPQAEAARLAASVVNAPPEMRADALKAVAAIVGALPATVKLADGSYASPQAVMGKQLLAAHMTPIELSAALDFGGDAAKLGRVTAALNDTTLAKALTANDQHLATANVRGAMEPYLASVAPLPGAADLAQARLDRTALVAKSLMVSQHMNAQDAARTAAADMTAGYRYQDGYRVPDAVAGATTLNWNGVHGGGDLVRAGAAKMLGALTGNQGAALYAPGGGDPATQRGVYATQIAHSARWVTTPDDSGLALMVPHADGTWDQVADKYGRPVRAGWSELQGVAQGHGQPSFLQAPSNPVHGPDGQPVAAFSKQSAMSAISWAVNGQESGFRDGVPSPKGALGQMQLMPDTVKTYAPRLGLPVDLARAANDADYNRQIGNAVLADHLGHFGATGPGLGLTLAAYNAGRGKVEGYTDAAGYHPGYIQQFGDPRTGKISLTAWVDKLPSETRGYIQHVLPAALGKLQGKG